MKKAISAILTVCLLLSMTVCAFALPAGDLNNNGAITAYDAQIVDEALHGARVLTAEQTQAAIDVFPQEQTLGVGHILAILRCVMRNEIIPINGVYEIWSKTGMRNMMNITADPADPEHETASFRLMADVDMQGVDWQPGELLGSFNGNGHTVYNLSVTSANETAGALFSAVGSNTKTSAEVKDLTLRNVSLQVSETVKNAGCLCGENYGTVRNCTVKDCTLSGNTKSAGRAGLLVGLNRHTLIAAGENSGSITGEHSNSNSLYGFNATGATAALVGERSDLTEDEMREKIVDYMYQMGMVEWTTGRDVNYECVCSNDYCIHNYVANKTYYGLPYTHNQGSLERAASVFSSVSTNAAGNTVLSGLKDYAAVPMDKSDDHLIDFSCYMGNDCSGAVFNAWAQVASSVSFRWTYNMVPTPENQAEYGILPLGGYEIAVKTFSGSEVPFLGVFDAEAGDWEFNAATNDPGIEQQLIDAWANARAGDAMVTTRATRYADSSVKNTGGHARLVCEDVVPVYKEDGSIDCDQTIVYTYEQGAGGTVNGKSSTWSMHGVTDDPNNKDRYLKSQVCGWTINQLLGKTKMKGDYFVYVPLTCKELQNAQCEQPAAQFTVASPVSGKVGSNYRVYSTTVEIAGQSSTIFSGLAGHHETVMQEGADPFTAYFKQTARGTVSQAARTAIRSVNLAKFADSIDLSALTSGQSYPFTVSMLLAGGTVMTYEGTYTAP